MKMYRNAGFDVYAWNMYTGVVGADGCLHQFCESIIRTVWHAVARL